MGKYSKYSKNYNSEWESLPIFQGWLEKGNLNNARCKVCKIELRAHKADLRKHAATKNHKQKASVPKSQQVLLDVGIITQSVSKEKKDVDLKFAAYITMHTSLSAMDHLCDLVKSTGCGSPLENMRLHRTKCTCIIRRVLSPSILYGIVDDINKSDAYFSIIIDESTDISVHKYLCLCVRYFSTSKLKMITEFLGLIEVTYTHAESLYEAITTFLKNNNLKTSKLVGVGTDGANNLCGRNKSVYTLLKNDIPSLVLIKCVCHSIHLCSQKAATELPAAIDFLLRETYNWFSLSVIRRQEYKQIFDLINVDENKNQYKIVQLSGTRWLSRCKAIEVILEQWLELQTHFVKINKKEKCYTARCLESMYKDPANFLYLIFLKPILKDLQATNLIFQSTNADFCKVYETLFSLVLNIVRRILKPLFLYETETDVNKRLLKLKDAILQNELSFLKLDEIDFGMQFLSELNNSYLTLEEKHSIKIKCFNFLKVLAIALFDKLPDNLKVLQMLRNFSPPVCLNQIRPPVNCLPLELRDPKVKIEEIENQWRNLVNINWQDYFKELPSDAIEFWSFVYTFTDACGNKLFCQLSDFALKSLSLPLSNAVVERVFSIMNAVKTRTRNKMILETLGAILRVRIHFYNEQICCKNFSPTEKMYELFNYGIYDNKSQTNEDETELQVIDNVLQLFGE